MTGRFGRAAIVAGSMLILATQATAAVTPQATWTADNGNGTYTNPLFYDEFSDPDMIRVGDDFYFTGTSMHAMPGLAILHSKDLVNWDFVTYAEPRLDLGPGYRLEGGKDIYGDGIWAPSFRYHKGHFYIFSNVNGQTTQLYTATRPEGPWTHSAMKRSFHDLSVLFDDDDRVYVVWGYDEIHMAELNASLDDIVPDSERVIIPKGSGMGEGSHIYKIDGKYYILSAWWDGRMRMPAARADHPFGPYEINPAISRDEDFGLNEGNRLKPGKAPPFTVIPANRRPDGRVSLHQGGIVSTPGGQWWGFSMMDYNSVGRLTSLSPVTWKDGWPYFGLPGNLGRTPRTWVKPDTGTVESPHAPYRRSDDFSARTLQPLWQWNHVPDDTHWSLSERPGFLRLHSLPAADFWHARNTLTQRAIGPDSRPTVALDVSGLKDGDVAGLALLNKPYAWIGVERHGDALSLTRFDENTGQAVRVPFKGRRIWLRADCDFMKETARFSYSTDGKTFKSLGGDWTMVFQLMTFQGVRYGLFNYNTLDAAGGYADFDAVDIHEGHPHGLRRNIPYGRRVALSSSDLAAPLSFTIENRSLGRVALKTADGYLSSDAQGNVHFGAASHGAGDSWQWIETPDGDLVLMSLASDRFLRVESKGGRLAADSPGPASDNSDGSRFQWRARSSRHAH